MHIVDQAMKQVSQGNSKVYISGIANRRIASVLQKRPDLFRLQFYTTKSGRLAFNVHLVDVPSVLEDKAPEQHCAVGDTVSDDERCQLTHRVRMFQQASRDHNGVWQDYCHECGFPSFDPAFVESVDLQLFFTRVQYKTASSRKSVAPIGGSINSRRPYISLS